MQAEVEEEPCEEAEAEEEQSEDEEHEVKNDINYKVHQHINIHYRIR